MVSGMASSVGGGFLGSAWEFNYRDIQRDMRKLLSNKNIVLARNIAKQTAHDSARAVAKIAKDIVAAEASDGGRLAASIGFYEPGYLKRKGTGSSPSDAYWVETTRGNIFFVEYGTTVSYAVPIFLGFTVSEKRVVFLPEEGRFITVRPFSFEGIHALDRAQAEFNSDPLLLQEIFNSNMEQLEFSWNSVR